MKKIIALCGYSGSGKSEAARILQEKYNIPKIISCTTRKQRKGETDGVDYRFVSEENFNKLKKLEEDYYAGAHYGLIKEDIDNAFINNDIVCTITTISGIDALKKAYPNSVHSVFISSDLKELKNRLRKRGESEEIIDKRMKEIQKEAFNRIFCQYEIRNLFSLSVLEKELSLLLNKIKDK